MSIHDAYADGSSEFLMNNPDATKLALDWMRQAGTTTPEEAMNELMERGEYHPRLLLDLAAQSYRDDPTLIDASAALRLKGMLGTGRLMILPIGPIDQPGGDKDVEGNNARLSGGLSEHDGLFTARFVGGAGDDDGKFSWTQEIVGATFQAGRECLTTIQPGTVPLEVGTTRAATTLLHLHRGGVARWPYYYSTVFLLLRTRRGFYPGETNDSPMPRVTFGGPL